MIFKYVLIIAAFLFQYMAIAKAEMCAEVFRGPSVKLLISNPSTRFEFPLIEHLISPTESNRIFDALSRSEVQFGASVFSRVIKVPDWLLEKFGDDVLQIRVRFAIMNAGEVQFGKIKDTFPVKNAFFSIRVSDPRNVEIASGRERELNKMLGGIFGNFSEAAISNPQLVESFLPRTRIYSLIRSAAEKIGENSLLLEGNRLSKWNVDDIGSEIALDLSNLSRAEVYVLLNEVARYLDRRSVGSQ